MTPDMVTASSPPSRDPRPVLFFVEGVHDIDLLRTFSVLLSADEPSLADLVLAETEGRLIFVPTGGTIERWACRFAALALPEFHLYDREVEPLTSIRRQLVARLNTRPRLCGALTGKRSLENYLHPDAIREACGVAIEVGPMTHVAGSVAQQRRAHRGGCSWQELTYPKRRRLLGRVKGHLNTAATAAMTMQRLAEQDPEGEVTGWLRTIGRLLEAAQ